MRPKRAFWSETTSIPATLTTIRPSFREGARKGGRMTRPVSVICADTNRIAESVETGWRLTNEYGVFVKLQFDCMFGHVKGFKYDTSAGVHVENESMESLITRFGLSFGKVFDQGRGSAYVNVSILNDY